MSLQYNCLSEWLTDRLNVCLFFPVPLWISVYLPIFLSAPLVRGFTSYLHIYSSQSVYNQYTNPPSFPLFHLWEWNFSVFLFSSINICCRFYLSSEYKQQFSALNPEIRVSSTLSSSDVRHPCSPVACPRSRRVRVARGAYHTDGLRGGEVKRARHTHNESSVFVEWAALWSHVTLYSTLYISCLSSLFEMRTLSHLPVALPQCENDAALPPCETERHCRQERGLVHRALWEEDWKWSRFSYSTMYSKKCLSARNAEAQTDRFL